MNSDLKLPYQEQFLDALIWTHGQVPNHLEQEGVPGLQSSFHEDLEARPITDDVCIAGAGGQVDAQSNEFWVHCFARATHYHLHQL